MNTVEVVLPAVYDNEWLLRVVNAFDEVDIEVKFVTPKNTYFYPQYPTTLPYTPTWTAGGITYSNDSNLILKNNQESFDKHNAWYRGESYDPNK